MTPRETKQKNDFPARSRQGNHTLIAVAAVAGVSIILRIAFLLKLQGTPFFLEHFSDSRLYMKLAGSIANGQGIEEAFFMSPLYPYLLALVWKITGSPELWMRLLQIAFGAATAVATMQIGRRIFSMKTGILAGMLVAVYAPLIYYDGLLLIESLQTLLLALSLLTLIRALQDDALRPWLLAGLMLGAAAVTRANILLWLPVFLLIWMFVPALRQQAEPRRIFLYVITAILCLVPSALHNMDAEGVFIPVTASFGYNLYAGNNAHAEGLYTMPEPVDLYVDLNGRDWVEQQTGRKQDASELSGWWRDRALAWMGEHPGDAAALLLRKILLFFHPGEIDQLGLSMEFFEQRYGSLLAVPQGAFPLIFLLAFAGMGVALWEGEGPERWLPILLLGVYVVATAMFFVSGRLRVPILPVLLLYASYFLTAFAAAWKRSDGIRRFRVPAAGGTVVAAGLLFFQPVVQQDFSHEYIKLGQLAFADGDYPGAEKLFRSSVSERATVDGRTNLGNALAAQNKAAEAAEQYRFALKMDSTYALAWFNFGNLWMQNNKPQYAYGYWKRALEYNPRLPGARRNLGLLLIQAGRLNEAAEHLRAYLLLEEHPGKRTEIQRDLARIDSLRRNMN